MKSDRVTLHADDALTAFSALRSSIRDLDTLLLEGPGEHFKSRDYLAKTREEKWQAYQRIAKAMGVPPTLDKLRERKSA